MNDIESDTESDTITIESRGSLLNPQNSQQVLTKSCLEVQNFEASNPDVVFYSLLIPCNNLKKEDQTSTERLKLKKKSNRFNKQVDCLRRCLIF